MSDPAVLYVSPAGRDEWSGSAPAPDSRGRDGPLATLEGARDRLRQLRAGAPLREGAVVWLRGGIYERTRSFALQAEDGGTREAPVSYRACPGEQVRLIGGRLLSDFLPVRDPVVHGRLAEQARDHVLQCDLAARGIADWGRFASRGFARPTTPAHLELFFQGRRMEVARWPNQGFAQIDAPAALHEEGDGHGGQLGVLEAGFVFAGKRPRQWRQLDDVWLHGYWAWDWANSYEQLDSYDAATGLIRTRPPHGLYGLKAGQRFYFLNVLEELDEPGEYYLDRNTGVLYFWPPAPLQASEAAVSILEEPFVCLDEVSHLTLAGLVLEYSRGSGVRIAGGSNVTVAGCTLRNLGNHGVLVEGGTGHLVCSCDICHTGDGGIRLDGGNRQTLDPGGHQAVNNHIHHIGQWSRCYQPGVMLAGVGHRVAHNLIHDGPHNAIQLGGNEHVIEYNHVHHVCQETGDVGVFYMGRDWTARGNVIRHNFFHHTQGIGMGSMAVYLDDCASGTTVFGNVFYQSTRAVFIGGGRNNRVDNNVFVECDPAVMIDGRGLDPRPVWRDMVHQTMKQSLDAARHHQPPYSLRYPDLKELDRFYQHGLGVPPEGNLVTRNICWHGPWLVVHWHATADMVAVQNNLVDEDPLFVDPAAMDFRLQPGSPAYELGFRPLPLEQIGLYADEYRCLPSAADR